MPRPGFFVASLLSIWVGLGCSETQISNSRSTCSSSVTHAYDAFNETATRIRAGGGVVMTFSLKSPVTMLGVRVKSGVYGSPVNLVVKVSRQAVNSGLIVPNDLDAELVFNATLAPEGVANTPVLRGIEFPTALTTQAVEWDATTGTQYAISISVVSGEIDVYEGYIPATASMQRRYTISLDGGSWNPGTEKGLTMGLKLKADCPKGS